MIYELAAMAITVWLIWLVVNNYDELNEELSHE